MRRSHGTLMTLIAAAMLGIAESTGLAPPPPIEVDEEVHWLAPEPEGDGQPDLAVRPPGPEELTAPDRVSASERSRFARLWAELSALTKR